MKVLKEIVLVHLMKTKNLNFLKEFTLMIVLMLVMLFIKAAGVAVLVLIEVGNIDSSLAIS